MAEATERHSIDYQRLAAFLREEYQDPVEFTFENDAGERQSEIDAFIAHSAVRTFIRRMCNEMGIEGVTGEPAKPGESARRR